MKKDKHTLAVYNKYHVHKTTVILNDCIVGYTGSEIGALIVIYQKHWWFAFLGNRQGFGSEERGNSRCF